MVNLFYNIHRALTINENADPDVRFDFESFINKLIPETILFATLLEGSDDMPAHLKSSILSFFNHPYLSNHSLNLGTWQGIYFCEFRNRSNIRKIIATIYS